MFAKKTLLFILIASCAALGVSSCSGKKKDTTLKVNTGLAARVGDLRISTEEMLRLYEEMPEMQKKEYKGRDGQAKFVDRLIEENLFYLAAIDEKMDKSDEMRDRIRWITMKLLITEYVSKKISDKIKVEPKEIEDYYAEHKEEFATEPVARAQYLFTTDSLKAVDWQKRLAKGELFTGIATKESEDKVTAPQGGDIGYFNIGSYMNGIGYSDILSKEITKLQVGKASGIIHFEKGFAIVKVTEKNPSTIPSLEEKRPEIEKKVRGIKMQAEYKQMAERLKQKYHTENLVRERLDKVTRTPDELWEMAQIETDPRARIQYYRDIVNLYPDHKNAPEALFMIGFTYAEELHDYPWARRSFDELERNYPKSSMIESAKWMRENMETEHPKIESMENMQKQMEEDKTRKAREAE